MANQTDKEYFTSKVFPRTLGFEGGQTNPNDGGSKSVWGVRQDVYNNYAKQAGKPATDVAELSHGDRNDFAYDEFFKRPKINKLPDGVSDLAFDYAFNSGAGQAIKDLQAVVGAEADGIIGKQTIGAVNDYIKKNGLAKLQQQYIDSRENHFFDIAQNNPAKAGNLNGWLNRLSALKNEFLGASPSAPQNQ